MKKLPLLFLFLCTYIGAIQSVRAQTDLYYESFNNVTTPSVPANGYVTAYISTIVGLNPTVSYAGTTMDLDRNGANGTYFGASGEMNLWLNNYQNSYNTDYTVSGINIAGYKNLVISFGVAYFYSQPQGDDIVINYSVDGGSWISAIPAYTVPGGSNSGDAFSVITALGLGFPGSSGNWGMVTLNLPATVLGTNMQLRVSRNGGAGILFDDLRLAGTPPNAITTLYQESFNNVTAPIVPDGSYITASISTITGLNPNVSYAGTTMDLDKNGANGDYPGRSGGINLWLNNYQNSFNTDYTVSGINIAGYNDLTISFGLAYFYSQPQGNDIVINYRVDGGSWISAIPTYSIPDGSNSSDAFAVITALGLGFPDSKGNWGLVTLNLPGSVLGTNMQLEVTRNGSAGLLFDDLKVTGGKPSNLATGITISVAGTAITTQAGTLQFSATITPSTATLQTATWSVTNGTGKASISSDGLLAALTQGNGIVTVTGTTQDGTLLSSSIVVTITNQAAFGISAVGGAAQIASNLGTLQITVTGVSNASNVQWSVANGTGKATINSDGLLTASTNGNGIVTVTGTTQDGTQLSSSLTVTITGQSLFAITASATQITTNGGTLQLEVTGVSDVSDVQWTVVNKTGYSSISSTGLLIAYGNGVVQVNAFSVVNGSVSGTYLVTLSGQNQNIVGADFETKFPSSYFSYGDGNTSITEVAGNPLKAGINPSDNVFSYYRSGTGGYPGAVMYFSGINSVDQSYLSFHLYTTATGVLSIYLGHDDPATCDAAHSFIGCDKDQITLTVIAPITPNQWVRYNFDLANLSGGDGIRRDKLTFKPNSALTGDNQWYNIDNVVFGLPYNPVTSVVASTQSGALSLVVGDSVQLLASVAPLNASDTTVVWSVTDGVDFVNLSPGDMLSAIAAGSVTVRATANDGSGQYSEIQVTVTAATAIAAQYDNAAINVYPNPSAGSVTVRSTESIGSITVADIFGKQVKEVSHIGKLKTIDLSDVAVGSYLLLIKTTDGRTYAKRFVKQ